MKSKMKPKYQEVKIKYKVEDMAEMVTVVNEDDYSFTPGMTESEESQLS